MAVIGIEANSNENQLLNTEPTMRTEQEITERIKELQVERKKYTAPYETNKNNSDKPQLLALIDTKILILQWVLKDELPF